MPGLISLTSIVGHSVGNFLPNLGIIFPGFVFVIIVISCSISWLFLVKRKLFPIVGSVGKDIVIQT